MPFFAPPSSRTLPRQRLISPPPAFILNLNFPACPCGQFPPSDTPSPFPVHAGHHAKLNAQPAETLQSRSRTPITLALKKRRVDELLAHLAGMPF